MAKVIPTRMTAEIEGDFVVFLIGVRINKPWQIHKWLPVFMAMTPMLKELEKHPEAWRPAAATSASGTKPIRCARVSTRRSTAACRPSVLAARPNSFRSAPGANLRGNGFSAAPSEQGLRTETGTSKFEVRGNVGDAKTQESRRSPSSNMRGSRHARPAVVRRQHDWRAPDRLHVHV